MNLASVATLHTLGTQKRCPVLDHITGGYTCISISVLFYGFYCCRIVQTRGQGFPHLSEQGILSLDIYMCDCVRNGKLWLRAKGVRCSVTQLWWQSGATFFCQVFAWLTLNKRHTTNESDNKKIIIVKYCDSLPYINVPSDQERQFLLFSLQHHTRPLQIWKRNRK